MEIKALVVYYSRSGHTKKVAEAIADMISGDTEEIIDTKKRSGPLGYVRSGRESMKEMLADIQEPVKDPSEYDLVIVGTPVWAMKMSTPVRAYLSKVKSRINNVAFFCTMGGKGDESTLSGMEEFLDMEPVAKMSFRSGDIKKGTYPEAVGKFIDMINI